MRVCSICHRCYEDEAISCTEDGHSPLLETRSGGLEMVSGYRLESMLETSAKGQIYRARQTAYGQPCRIRIVATDENSSQRFLDEAKLAATLFHPNIADVYEVGSLDSGEVFVVTEDPEGETLRGFLTSAGVPELLSSIQIVRETAEALHVLHLKGLTHRAIAPENIILTTDAEDRLLVRIKDPDFGGVTGHSIISNKFSIDSEIDSLKYFAPEQCTGEGAGIKTDIYALGIVLYEMLAGSPPFEAPKASGVIEMHRNQRPPDIKIDNFDLRMLLTHTLMEALQKRPEYRQSSADAFARQLRHMEQLATHVSTPPPAGVVPSAPPSADVSTNAVTTSHSVTRPAPAIETPKAIYKEERQPAATASKREPAPIVESVPIPPMSLERSTTDRPQTPETLSEVAVIESAPKEKREPPAPRPSRLKTLRKKLHQMTGSFSLEKPENNPLPAVPANTGPEETAIYRTARETTAARPRVEPKKIEWEQPEDDIPSLEDVQEVLAMESLPEGSTAFVEPKKGEWDQPEDDIPSLEDVQEVLAMELLPEVSVATAIVEPKKVEWEQPEDDIPSLEDVQEVLAMPEVSVATAIVEPKKIEWDQYEDDIPSIEDVQEVVANGELPETPAEEEPEEITLVTPPGRKIRIDLDRPTARQYSLPFQNSSVQASGELVFYPTILGARGEAIDGDSRDSIFSAYAASSGSGFSVGHRSLTVGGGLLVLVVAFFFGDGILRRVGLTDDQNSSVVSKTVGTQRSVPASSPNEGILPPDQKPLQNVKEPAPKETAADTSRTKTETVQASAPVSGAKPRNVGGKTLDALPVPSTLVITADKGQVKMKVEPAKVAADPKSPLRTDETSPYTRPRIVSDPRP